MKTLLILSILALAACGRPEDNKVIEVVNKPWPTDTCPQGFTKFGGFSGCSCVNDLDQSEVECTVPAPATW